MKEIIDYRLRDVNRKVWEDFKKCLRKVYWRENLTISDGIIRLIKKFIEEHEK